MAKPGLTAVLVVVVLAASAASAFGWGMAAHAYIAERCLAPFPNADMMNQALYGAALPDIYDLDAALNPGSPEILRELTHASGFVLVTAYTGVDPALQWFARGWVTHNELWGADYFAHIVDPFRPPQIPGYVVQKAAALSQLGWLADEYVEAAIDILVRKKVDGGIGDKLTRAAVERRAGVPDLLCRAYCPPYPSVTLTRAETAFRASAIAYGDALDLSGSLSKYAFARSLGAYGRISFLRSLNYLERAISLCEPDFRQALDTTVNRIKYP